ncbi:hypothetical protein A3L08_08225 [Thermococcus pacificus]|uniref:Uncharacterized protein n=1 Tax=Thermococcus pacificus TaxID=71998 RepID=A0A218P933_9EURY|nr:hypothetical protein A3L08_08225 [Thermococcus pacificus]
MRYYTPLPLKLCAILALRSQEKKRAIATTIPNPKKLLVPMNDAGAATLCGSFQSHNHPWATAKMRYL